MGKGRRVHSNFCPSSYVFHVTLQRNDEKTAFPESDESERLALKVRVVGVGAGLQKKVREGEVTVLRRQVERRQLVRVVCVNLGARVDQMLRNLRGKSCTR